MQNKPRLEAMPEIIYAAIKMNFKRDQINSLIPPLWDELSLWLRSVGIEQAGAPFIKYLKTDEELEAEIGIPVIQSINGNERIHGGVFPEGTYAVLTYFGPYEGLYDANAELILWGNEKGLQWKTELDKEGKTIWLGRAEIYLTDPAQEPDDNKWETDIIIQVE